MDVCIGTDSRGVDSPDAAGALGAVVSGAAVPVLPPMTRAAMTAMAATARITSSAILPAPRPVCAALVYQILHYLLQL